MNKPLLILLFFVISSLPATAMAFPDGGYPQVVKEAMNDYQATGHSGFFKRLVQFGPLAKTQDVEIGKFTETVKDLGFFREATVVKSQALTDKVTRVYLVIHYTQGVIFMRMDTYQPPEGRMITTTFKYSVDSEDILPFVFTDKGK